MPRGGKRPGAGRPKGSKSKSTLARLARRKNLEIPKEATLVALAREATADVLAMLKDIMGNTKERTADRIAAGRIILERGWGRPKERIEIDESPGTDPAETVRLIMPGDPDFEEVEI